MQHRCETHEYCYDVHTILSADLLCKPRCNAVDKEYKMPYQHNENSLTIVTDDSRVDVNIMEPIPTKSVCWIDQTTFDPNTMKIVVLCSVYCEATYCNPVCSSQ